MTCAVSDSLWAILPFGGIGTGEMLVLGILAVLLFGSRLPEMGRSIGRGLMEFKKGLSGIEEEIRSATQTNPPPRRTTAQRTFNPLDDREESTAPKFEPPPAEPRTESSTT